MEKFSKLKDLLGSVETDVEKFYTAGNGAAGTRVRKAMQELKALAQGVRTEIAEKRKSVKL